MTTHAYSVQSSNPAGAGRAKRIAAASLTTRAEGRCARPGANNPPDRSRATISAIASDLVRTTYCLNACIAVGQSDAAVRSGHLTQTDLEKPMSSSITAEGPTGTFAGLGRLRFLKTILSRLILRRKSQNTSIVSCSPGQRL